MPDHDLLDDFISGVPAPGTTPGEHLAHTLAAFAHLSDQAQLPNLGGPIVLLRRLDNADARLCLAHLAAGKVDDDFAVAVTSGVYGTGVTTGLTWADVRALAG